MFLLPGRAAAGCRLLELAPAGRRLHNSPPPTGARPQLAAAWCSLLELGQATPCRHRPDASAARRHRAQPPRARPGPSTPPPAVASAARRRRAPPPPARPGPLRLAMPLQHVAIGHRRRDGCFVSGRARCSTAPALLRLRCGGIWCILASPPVCRGRRLGWPCLAASDASPAAACRPCSNL